VATSPRVCALLRTDQWQKNTDEQEERRTTREQHIIDITKAEPTEAMYHRRVSYEYDTSIHPVQEDQQQ
jgi:hypothetical protein